MRWRFPSHANINETAQRLQIGDAIDAWWRAFREATQRLDALFIGESDWDLPGIYDDSPPPPLEY
jgi:hypothetical protein